VGRGLFIARRGGGEVERKDPLGDENVKKGLEKRVKMEISYKSGSREIEGMGIRIVEIGYCHGQPGKILVRKKSVRVE